jgi:DNA modification methylase
VIWNDGYEIRAFEDRWKGGIENYTSWMKPRLEECYRVLKENGSMYLHCNWYANHYLRIIMDKIFQRNITCEIIWDKGFRGTERQKNWQQSHDTILFYTKGERYIWHDQFQEYADTNMKRYNKTDDQGRKYALIKRKRTDGTIYYGKTYPKAKGKRMNDIIHVPVLAATAKERLGFPTQKPEKLLEYLIGASSNPTDIVLDPYCGCGTAIAVAHKMGRRWIGIDISPTACNLMALRFHKMEPPVQVLVVGMPLDEVELRKLPHFEFQNWVCQRMFGRVSSRKSSDMGIDGYTFEGHPIQVKQSDSVGRNVVDNFETALRRHGDKNGVIVAFSFGKGAYEESARAQLEDGLKITLLTTKELVEQEERRKEKLQPVQSKIV